MLQTLLDNMQIILSVLGVVSAPGCCILFFRQERQTRELDNVSKQIAIVSASSAEWKNIADERKDENDRLSAKIDEVYDELNEERNARRHAEEEVSHLIAENGVLTGTKCIDFTCTKRNPPISLLVKMADVNNIPSCNTSQSQN